MRNRLKPISTLAKLLLLSLLAMPLLPGTVTAADQPAGPTVSKGVAKPLKAAQDAMTAKNYDEAIAKIKEVQAQGGEKTAYDNFAMNIMLFQAYSAKHDMASAVPILAIAAQSQYASAEQKKVWLKNIALFYFQEKDYNKALDAANDAVKNGVNDLDVLNLIAKSQYLLGKYKEAAITMQEVVGKQDKPDEESLKLLWQFDLKANDTAGAAKAVEKLVAYYPKPEYWANALASLVNADTKDAHLQLNVYRLMSDVGVLKRGGDYAEMADIALDEGYPGETQSVLQKAFAENVFTEQRDKDRYQHLLDGAKQRAAADQAALPKSEQDALAAPNGDRLVQVGAAYLSYGQNDKAIAAITKGIAKGNLKYPEEANLLLGIAQLRSHNAADAQRSFEKVGASSNSGYARLGKLWALHAGAKSV
jgi:Anaphase-promoting complex, cyclosome, subunit 3